MVKKGIIQTDRYMTKEQKILYRDIGQAILKYNKKKIGNILIDDVRMLTSSKEDGWILMSFYFKVLE